MHALRPRTYAHDVNENLPSQFDLIQEFLFAEAANHNDWLRLDEDGVLDLVQSRVARAMGSGITPSTIAQFKRGKAGGRRGLAGPAKKGFSPSDELLRGLMKIAGVHSYADLYFKLEKVSAARRPRARRRPA
jgi:hypothetical protein